MNVEDALNDLDAFRRLPHAITLLGMSGVGKTMLSTQLHRAHDWFHYSADYRIGTRYLAEDILDNIKAKIMRMRDPFVANLLRSDSIYINHNISVGNLEPVSTYLGMYGDPEQGGLDKSTFLDRQMLYCRAEQLSMRDVKRFISKAWNIYGCRNFINDASGSLCEIADIDNPEDPVIRALRSETLVLYIRAGRTDEDALIARAESDPKPLFYKPEFIHEHLGGQPDDGIGVGPKDFARTLFPKLVADRKPRYEAFAEKYGFSVNAADLFDNQNEVTPVPTEDAFTARLFDIIRTSVNSSEVAKANAHLYIMACIDRAHARSMAL